MPVHENLNIRYLPPMPSYFRLLYFGLVMKLSGDVTGEKHTMWPWISAATATSALRALLRPTLKKGDVDSQ